MTLAFRELAGRAALLADTSVWGVSVPTLVALLFFWGATAKSAQIPLYVWLPDAMAGPTPVSALIHAATMVTAGVYMIARCNFLYVLSPEAMTVVTCVGALTALFAASIGVFQHDIKKVLAYSTVSQLGFMFMAVGVGAWWVGIFHLMTHAFFKACLFLGSGSVIHAMGGEQDMRRMGGLGRAMPQTRRTYLISCCAIAGLPVFSGFFSKDEILWQVYSNATTLVPGWTVWAVASAAALMTAFYMFRSYFMTFTGECRADHHTAAHLHESPPVMTGVLWALAVLAAVGGFVGLPKLWHLPNFFEHWMEPVFARSSALLAQGHHGHAAEWALMLLAVGLGAAGIFIAHRLYWGNRSTLPARLAARFPTVHRWVYNKYYVDELYDATVVRLIHALRRGCDWFDRRVIDGIVNAAGRAAVLFAWVHGKADEVVVDGAVNGVAQSTIRGGRTLRRVQTGRIQTYLYGILGGALALALLNYILFTYAR
jgi:NADH-quinone oxidoreductase subunit L